MRIDTIPSTSPTSRAAPKQPTAPAFRDVIEYALSVVFEIEVRDLRSPTRGKKETAFARQVGMYLAHVSCGLTFTDIGRLFERDRTTVAHACGRIEDRRDDEQVDRILDLLEGVVGRLADVTLPSLRRAT